MIFQPEQLFRDYKWRLFEKYKKYIRFIILDINFAHFH